MELTMKNTTVSFQIPEALSRRLDELAKDRLVSKSDLIRKLILDHIETIPARAHKSKRR